MVRDSGAGNPAVTGVAGGGAPAQSPIQAPIQTPPGRVSVVSPLVATESLFAVLISPAFIF